MMWTIRIRWKVVLQVFVCSWRGHDRDRFYAPTVWHSSDHFCHRCRATRPAFRRRHEDVDGARFGRMYVDWLDWDGQVIAIDLSGSSVKGDRLGRVWPSEIRTTEVDAP